MERLVILTIVLFLVGCAGGESHRHHQQLQGQSGQYVPVGGNNYLNTATGQVEQQIGRQMFGSQGRVDNVINSRVYDQSR